MDTKGWDVAWEQTDDDEWVVEYVVLEGGRNTRHLSLLLGADADAVRAALVDEIRELYPDASHIEVTVLRLEAVHDLDTPNHGGLHVP